MARDFQAYVSFGTLLDRITDRLGFGPHIEESVAKQILSCLWEAEQEIYATETELERLAYGLQVLPADTRVITINPSLDLTTGESEDKNLNLLVKRNQDFDDGIKRRRALGESESTRREVAAGFGVTEIQQAISGDRGTSQINPLFRARDLLGVAASIYGSETSQYLQYWYELQGGLPVDYSDFNSTYPHYYEILQGNRIRLSPPSSADVTLRFKFYIAGMMSVAADSAALKPYISLINSERLYALALVKVATRYAVEDLAAIVDFNEKMQGSAMASTHQRTFLSPTNEINDNYYYLPSGLPRFHRRS